MTEFREDCYFYYESQEMSARVPNCIYGENYEYGFCPCNNNCKNYISKKEANKLIKKIVRCKDCIYKEEHPSPYWKYWCNRLKCGCDDDWFCADGEKKDDD